MMFSQQGHWGVVTLNRPTALNALTLSMIVALKEKLLEWQSESAIRAVMIMASSGKAFCAGGDVRWLWDAGQRQDPAQLDFFKQEYQLNALIHAYPKPYVALMDGLTMGGGVGIALHGSHPVGSERFVFSMPETAIGFFPDIGASYLLSRCPDHIGVYLGLTGERLDIANACALGLVKQSIVSERFPSVIETLLKMDLSHDAHESVSACLADFAYSRSHASIVDRVADIRECFQYDTMAEIMSALAHYTSPWHQETHRSLLAKSPLSLKVTLAQLRKAEYLSFEGCMALDQGLVQQFMRQNDFYEGVRALLIDKDRAPCWQHHTLEDVTDDEVAGYFVSQSELV